MSVQSEIRSGVKRLTRVETVAGVAAVLAGGAVIGGATGLLPQGRNVQTAGLAVLSAAALGFAAAGGAGWSQTSRRAARAFSGVVGLMAAAQLALDLLGRVRSTNLMAEDVAPDGEGAIFGNRTSEKDYSPLGQRAETFHSEQFEAEVYPVDFGQYHPLDSHHQDLAGQPPIWLAEEVPEVAQAPATATADNVVVSGTFAAKSEDTFGTWIAPSHTQNSAGHGHGVPQWFGAEYANTGNNFHAAEGNGHVMGQ